jgi:hypothetical protein
VTILSNAEVNMLLKRAKALQEPLGIFAPGKEIMDKTLRTLEKFNNFEQREKISDIR